MKLWFGRLVKAGQGLIFRIHARWYDPAFHQSFLKMDVSVLTCTSNACSMGVQGFYALECRSYLILFLTYSWESLQIEMLSIFIVFCSRVDLQTMHFGIKAKFQPLSVSLHDVADNVTRRLTWKLGQLNRINNGDRAAFCYVGTCKLCKLSRRLSARAFASLNGLLHRAGGGSKMPNSFFMALMSCSQRSSQ